MADFRKMFDSEYLASWDLDDDITVVIAKVVAGEVGGHQGSDKQKRPIMYFEGAKKGMVCNKTNAKSIASLYGNDTDAWIGKKITLYVGECEAFGEVMSCLRVRPAVPK